MLGVRSEAEERQGMTGPVVGALLAVAVVLGAAIGVGHTPAIHAQLPPFPQYSRTADADPSIRHEVVVPMPNRLSVERNSDRLSVGFDLASPRKVKITVGRKMNRPLW
jgi:hypothetical protein